MDSPILSLRAVAALCAAVLATMIIASAARAQRAPAPAATATDEARAEELAKALFTNDAALQRLIQEALEAGPELASAAARLEAQRQRVPQASALADPMLQLGIQNDGFTSLEIGAMDTSFLSLMVSQTFPWPGKRQLARALAARDVTIAELACARARLTTEAEVRRGYVSLLLARDRLALLSQLEDVLGRASELIRARYAAGDGAQAELLRAQLELARIRQRRVTLAQEERSLLATLNRLRARPMEQPIESSAHLRDLPALATLEALFSVARARAASPELAQARLAAQRAGDAAALAGKGLLPDLTVSAGIMFRGELAPMWLVTVAAPLPVFAHRKQRRAVDERRAQTRAAQQDVVALERGVALRSQERHLAFAALREIIELYSSGVLLQSEAATAATLSQYKVGKGPFSAVLEANAGFLADQEGYLEALAAAYQLAIAEAELSDAAPAAPTAAAAAVRLAPADAAAGM